MVQSAEVQNILDPTGAGDAYRAGLLKGLAMGKDIETAAKIGAVAAAYAIENYGTQEHYFTYEEFMERYERNFRILQKITNLFFAKQILAD